MIQLFRLLANIIDLGTDFLYFSLIDYWLFPIASLVIISLFLLY